MGRAGHGQAMTRKITALNVQCRATKDLALYYSSSTSTSAEPWRAETRQFVNHTSASNCNCKPKTSLTLRLRTPLLLQISFSPECKCLGTLSNKYIAASALRTGQWSREVIIQRTHHPKRHLQRDHFFICPLEVCSQTMRNLGRPLNWLRNIAVHFHVFRRPLLPMPTDLDLEVVITNRLALIIEIHSGPAHHPKKGPIQMWPATQFLNQIRMWAHDPLWMWPPSLRRTDKIQHCIVEPRDMYQPRGRPDVNCPLSWDAHVQGRCF